MGSEMCIRDGAVAPCAAARVDLGVEEPEAAAAAARDRLAADANVSRNARLVAGAGEVRAVVAGAATLGLGLVAAHGGRCLEATGLGALPWCGVIDCRSCNLGTKHSRTSFEAAMRIAEVSDPAACVAGARRGAARSALGARAWLLAVLAPRRDSRPLSRLSRAHCSSQVPLPGD